MTATRFAYKPKTLVILLAALFFLLCVVVLVFTAGSNEAGLVINGLIHLDQGSSTIFYYVLAGLAALMGAAGVFLFVSSLGPPRFLVLDDTGVEIPGAAGRKTVRVAYDAITGLQAGGAHRQRWLYVMYPGGRQAIMGSMLASNAQLDEIANLLAARVPR